MSKTDKTRPWWVIQHDPTLHSRVVHDHRHGACVVESPEYARWNAASSTVLARHIWSGTCPRWDRIIEFCAPDRGESRPWCRAGWAITVGVGPRWDHTFLGAHRVTLTCEGHPRMVPVAPDAACATCDSVPPTPTCRVRVLDCPGERPAAVAYLANRAERSARRATRSALRAAARDWNTHGDTDIEPVPAWHRDGARWDAW
jgi:hypothetical protein